MLEIKVVVLHRVVRERPTGTVVFEGSEKAVKRVAQAVTTASAKALWWFFCSRKWQALLSVWWDKKTGASLEMWPLK